MSPEDEDKISLLPHADHEIPTRQREGKNVDDLESSSVAEDDNNNNQKRDCSISSSRKSEISYLGLQVLVLLSIQNCTKNLLTRYVLMGTPPFLFSAAVIGTELLKLSWCILYILFVEKRTLSEIIIFFYEDNENTKLLFLPACLFCIQQTLEYVALSNINASIFSILVQSKLLTTAMFSVVVLRTRLRKGQIISLLLLTTGAILCNLAGSSTPDDDNSNDNISDSTIDDMDIIGNDDSHAQYYRPNQSKMAGYLATLGIALSSGFAGVYTEKVIKKKRAIKHEHTESDTNADSKEIVVKNSTKDLNGSENVEHHHQSHPIKQQKQYSLAYMQLQLGSVSLLVMGTYALIHDWHTIIYVHHGNLFHNFSYMACISILNSAFGGIMVAASLKYADAVLKGYATSVSVILTGIFSWSIFHDTTFNTIYLMGISNVVLSIILYSTKDLDEESSLMVF